MAKGGHPQTHFKRHPENFPTRVDPTRSHKNRVGIGGGEKGRWKHGGPRHQLQDYLKSIDLNQDSDPNKSSED